MIRRAAAGGVLTLVFVLAGCAGAQSVEMRKADEVPASADDSCIEVSSSVVEGLQWGLDQRQDGLVAERAVAHKPQGVDFWLVAGEFTGPGLDPPAVGVWATWQDPSSSGEIAFVSVDSMAAEFSDYARPSDWSAAIPGVSEVEACL